MVDSVVDAVVLAEVKEGVSKADYSVVEVQKDQEVMALVHRVWYVEIVIPAMEAVTIDRRIFVQCTHRNPTDLLT